MKYSVCFKDAFGATERSEFTPFTDDAAATAYAQTNLSRNAIIEVWHGDALISRLFRDPTPSVTASWENEGGAITSPPLTRH